MYVAAEDLSIEETEVRMEWDHFDLKNYLKRFWPTN